MNTKNNVIKILIKSILPKYCTTKQQKILQIPKESNVFETIIQQHVLPRGHATFWHGSPDVNIMRQCFQLHYGQVLLPVYNLELTIFLTQQPFVQSTYRTHRN